MKIAGLIIVFLLGGFFVNAQQIGSSPVYVYTINELCFFNKDNQKFIYRNDII